MARIADTKTSDNPYAAPRSELLLGNAVPLDPEVPHWALATRKSRLTAQLVDGLLAFVIVWTGLLFADEHDLGWITTTWLAVGLMILAVINLVLLNRHGQTIGKRLTKIKIVRKSGARADLLAILVLRMLVPSLLELVSGVFFLSDVLFIFGQQRRCLHDYIAGTVVVDVNPVVPRGATSDDDRIAHNDGQDDDESNEDDHEYDDGMCDDDDDEYDDDDDEADRERDDDDEYDEEEEDKPREHDRSDKS